MASHNPLSMGFHNFYLRRWLGAKVPGFYRLYISGETMDSNEAKSLETAPAWTIWAALLTVGLVLFGGYRLLFVEAPAFELDAAQKGRFDACAAAFKRVDSNAVIPLRPVNAESIGWPANSGFVLNGGQSSASCIHNPDGTLHSITVNGRDLPLSAGN